MLGLIPSDIEDYIAARPGEFQDYQSILAHARVQTVYRRTRTLAEHARKHAGRINSFVEATSDKNHGEGARKTSESAPETNVSPDVKALVAQMKKMDARVKRLTKPGTSTEQRSNSRERKPLSAGSAKRYRWTGGCFHCEADHQRKDCPEFQDLMKKTNVGKKKEDWKLPHGYKGAFEKSREKWQKSQPKEKINELVATHETEDDSEDVSDSDVESSRKGFFASFLPVRKGTPLKQASIALDSVQTNPLINRFHVLQDDKVDMLNHLNGWAHSVKCVKSGKSEFSLSKEESQSDHVEDGKLNFHITCEKDLEEFLRTHPLIASVGSRLNTKKAAAKAAKKLASVHLEEDERLILLDSGSSMDAADIGEEFPAYSQLVVLETDQETGNAATTACGGIVVNKGKVIIGASIEDNKGGTHDFPLPFNDMKVQIPILSLRNTMKRGHTARLNDKGGYLRKLSDGAKIPVYEKEGVYYLKVKLHKPPPVPPPPPPVPESGFARPGQ